MADGMRPILGRDSLVGRVGEALRDAIDSGALRAGELHSANEIAEQLGVSRTPVREALLVLADAGMVQLERNRGFRVLQRSPEHIAEVFQLRLLLEVPAAWYAAARAGPELAARLRAQLDAMHAAAAAGDEQLVARLDRGFHELVLNVSQNRTLTSTVAGLRDRLLAVGASTADRSRSLADIAQEHEPILAALSARDPDAAAAALVYHLRHTGMLLTAQVAAENGADVPARALALLEQDRYPGSRERGTTRPVS
jgi:DNA-binding GntR family transcriptional regulator